MIFKRPPRDYQLEDFEHSKDLRYYAYLYQMGLGKSKLAVDTATHLYSRGKINALAIVAPNGIHIKWAKEDIETDLPDQIDHRLAIWRSGDKKAIEQCEKLIGPGEHLRILCINIESLSRDKSPAEDFLKRFLRSTDCMLVIDESDTIKNPDAKRTKRLIKLGDLASYKRILTGTPINNDVFDLYSQFTFLNEDIFGQSFTSFKHTYAEILPPNHPTIQAILARGARFTPTLVAKDSEGKPIWKNIDDLKARIRPYSTVRKKADHLNLPDKIYESIYYELEPKQRQIYNDLKTKAKAIIGDSSLTIAHKLTALLRLQQTLSGFLPTDLEEGLTHLFKDPKDNPRIQALLTALETYEHTQIIVWCRFVDEIKMIEKLLGDQCVTYYGGTVDREANLALFKSGQRRIMVSNTAVGGAGLNLTNSHIAIYYSSDFSYRNRAQSEDRQHRIGQTESVVCIDIIAEDSIDEYIAKSVRAKKDVAIEMMKL